VPFRFGKEEYDSSFEQIVKTLRSSDLLQFVASTVN